MDILKSDNLLTFDALAQTLDKLRARYLRISLRPSFLRTLYSLAHLRLLVGMILTCLICLPLAFAMPDFILAFGPLVFGYPHLVMSYRYSTGRKLFGVFLVATVVAISLHLTQLFGLPFGIWQLIVATLTFFATTTFAPYRFIRVLLVSVILVTFAWLEPVVSIGAMLILHNWIAFLFWIKVSTSPSRKITAVGATVLFLLIHMLVLGGRFDALIPGSKSIVDFPGGTETTGWYLASWSSDPIVWYRLLVLYTFGLSVHYFVWLRAIPESKSGFEHPSSCRLILQNLRKELGERVLLLCTLFVIGALIVWGISFPLGNRLYFELAILHGSIEIMYLAGSGTSTSSDSETGTRGTPGRR